MDETILREKIGALLLETRGVPSREAEAEPAGRTCSEADLPSALKRDRAVLEDGLDHLRLAIKYLVFDLEATKRENRVLREMLG